MLRLPIALLLVVGAGTVRAEPLRSLAGHQSDAVAELVAEGGAPPAHRLQMQAYLTPRNRRALERLLDEQQNPSSPRYHRWLSAAEYDRRFAPARADVHAVARWLRQQGFRVTRASAREARVAFEGSVATTENAFAVRMAASRDGRYYGNVGDPQVPARLAASIRHIDGLHNLHASVWHTKITDPSNNNQLTSPHFGPPDVWVYANARALLDAGMNGSGQCIAALEGSDVDQASLVDFNTVFGLPPLVAGQNYDVVYPDGPPGIELPVNSRPSEAYAEAVVDIEWAHGIAPGARIVLYAGDHPRLKTQGLVNTLIAATADNRCPVITISWGQCGAKKSFFRMLDGYYKRAAAQGQTIFVATGDVGVAFPTLFDRKTGGCQSPKRPTIEENAASPNVTAIGATQIQNAQYDAAGVDTGVGVPAEAVWFFDVRHLLKSASTGGVSAIFKKPRFQQGIKSVKFGKRAVPDICLGGGTPARPGYWECLDVGLYRNGIAAGASCTNGGGTSIAAPQWAGVLAIILQKKGARLGNINPRLYAMAKKSLGNLAAVGIRDVTEGSNGYDPLPGYPAGPGYDLASGWGSIDIGTFVDAFLASP